MTLLYFLFKALMFLILLRPSIVFVLVLVLEIVIYFFKVVCSVLLFFFFSSRRRHTRSYGDWSSDVCSSDLVGKTILMSFLLPSPALAEGSSSGSSCRPTGLTRRW